jgi:hypothetical protein
MAQKFDYSYRPFTLAADTGAYVRVKLDGTNVNQVAIAGAGENCIGVTDRAGKSGDVVNVKLLEGGEGTFKVTASGAIAANAALYGTANGQVDDSGSGVAQFTSAAATSGSGSIIEAYKRIPVGTSTFIAGAAVANPAATTQDTLTVTGMTGTANTAPAAETNLDTLTDNSGGSASTTLAAISDTPTKNAVASLAAELAKQKTLNAVLINDAKSFATELNLLKTDHAAALTTINALLVSLRSAGTIGT